MRKSPIVIVAAFAVLVGTPWAAWGQFGGMTSTNTGTFGSRSLGQAMGGAARSFGGNTMGSGRGMSSGMGMGTGMGNNLGSGMGMGMGSSSFGSNQFRFATRRQGDFVGADLADINTSILGGLTGTSGASGGMGGRNAMGGASTLGSVGGSQGMGTQGGNFASTRRQFGRRSSSGSLGSTTGSQQMSLGLDLKFDVDRPPDSALSSAATRSLAKSMRLPAGAPVEVAVQDGTAVLRGVVATAHDRALAEQLVLLEPGIARVVNELEVGPNGATLGKATAPGSSGSAGSTVLPPR